MILEAKFHYSWGVWKTEIASKEQEQNKNSTTRIDKLKTCSLYTHYTTMFETTKYFKQGAHSERITLINLM